MTYCVGLDVGLRTLALCVVDAKGEIVLERLLACEVADVTDVLKHLAIRLR